MLSPNKNKFRENKKNNKSTIKKSRKTKSSYLENDNECTELANGDYDIKSDFIYDKQLINSNKEICVSTELNSNTDTIINNTIKNESESEFNDSYFEQVVYIK